MRAGAGRGSSRILRHFLAAFSSGQSLYASVREARRKAAKLEGKYPCATWLPVICQIRGSADYLARVVWFDKERDQTPVDRNLISLDKQTQQSPNSAGECGGNLVDGGAATGYCRHVSSRLSTS